MAGSRLVSLFVPIFVILCFHSLDGYAQTNLVLNPSFEDYSTCPTNISQFYSCVINWHTPTNASSDYFNECDSLNVNPEKNTLFGYQVPRTGKAFAGIYGFENNYREYLQGTLVNSLKKGRRYSVGFYVSLAINYPSRLNSAIADLGAYFSSNSFQYASYKPLGLIPQVANSHTKILDDTLNWTLVSGNFRAVGTERYITIGNFYIDAKTNIKTIVNYALSAQVAYYFIDDVSVSEMPLLIIKDTVYICKGEKKAIKGTGLDTIGKWNDNTISDSIIVDKPGKYWKNYISYGDTTIDTVIVILDTFSVKLPKITLCKGRAKTIKLPRNGATYVWNGKIKSDSFTIVKPGKYFVTAIGHECISSDTMIVNYDSNIVVNLPPDSIICQGQTINLDVSNISQNVKWQDSSTNKIYLVTKPGLYSVKAQNACGTFKDSIRISEINLEDSIRLPKSLNLCKGQTQTISIPKDKNQYVWNGNDTNRSFTVSKPGVYYISALRNGCVGSDTIVVNYDSAVVVKLPRDTILCNGISLLLDLSNIKTSINWQDGTINKKYSASKAGTYIATTQNACGVFKDSIMIKFEDCNCYLYIPNSFTPEGNGRNDSLKAIGNCQTTKFLLSIYNRWGECIYQSNDINKGWDGTFRNVPCIEGVYLWMIDLKYENTTEELRKGTVTLMR